MKDYNKATLLGVFLNIILFVIKLIGGILSGSLAVMSDAFNSLTDIVSYTGIFFAVRWSRKEADESHPFGHRRAEPLAAIIVSILAGILGFEIIRTAIGSIINHKDSILGLPAIIVLIFTIITKYFMAIFFLRKGKTLDSPALKAAGIDSRNDVLISSIALIGVIASLYKSMLFDDIAAIFIALFVIYSGYKMGAENIGYLMGKAPSKDIIKKIKYTARKIKGVTGINDIRAHYVGNIVHIEVHVEVDKDISTQASHKICKDVQNAVEKIKSIDRAFIHIDPR